MTDQTTTPHRWAEAIHAFAKGKPIQFRSVYSLVAGAVDTWVTWESEYESPNFNCSDLEWRPAPPRPWYRKAIIKGGPPLRMMLVENETQEKRMQEAEEFICWDGPRTEYDPK